MLNFFKVLFWGSLVNQSIITIFLWLCAGAAFYELHYVGEGSKGFSPVMIGTFIVSFIIGSYIYSKGRSNQSLEEQISMGISRAKSPATSGMADLIVIGFLTISISFIIVMSFQYMVYVASGYSIYMIVVQLYKKKKTSIQN